MRKIPWIILIFILLCASVSALARAQETPKAAERDPAEEQEIYDRLAEVNPDAVPVFQEATRALDSGNLEKAKSGYETVLELAPEFPDADRRLSYVLLQLDEVEDALRHAQRAYRNDATPFNQITLAMALLMDSDDPEQHKIALDHALAAAEVLPDDPFAVNTLFWAGVMNREREIIRSTSQKLMELTPDFPTAHYYAGLVYAFDGKWEDAERHLLLARELGMSAGLVESVLQEEGIRTQARNQRWKRRGLYGLGAWAAGMGILFLVGMLLSKLTLRAVYRSQSAARFEIGTGERILRNIYRVVIAITSVSFYFSIPLLILVVVAVTLAIFYLFISIGRVPIYLMLFVGMTAILTLYAIMRSMFARVKDEEPGRPLPREEAPRLWALTQEVAERLDTRPVEAIYLTPGTDIAVMERGGMWKKLRGRGQRCLILGLGALPDLPQSQFVSILAHEYGHFSNRDTAGGNLAHQVRLSIHQMALGLAMNDLARWYNPAWIFVNGFNRIFLVVTLGASRLQEILADRYAAMAYGVRDFVNGLKHVIHQGLTFDLQVASEIQSAKSGGRRLNNVYTLPPLQAEGLKKELEAQMKEIMTRPTSPYDSHPVPQERIALLEKLNIADTSEASSATVWDLFPDPNALQAEMTGIIQMNVDEREAMVKAQLEAQRQAMEE